MSTNDDYVQRFRVARMSNAQLADWLEELDSHGIYGIELLSELPDDLAAAVPTQSAAAVKREMDARGLGGTINMDDPERPLVVGWVAAEALCRERLGHERVEELLTTGTGIRIQGRGRIHRDCIAALRNS